MKKIQYKILVGVMLFLYLICFVFSVSNAVVSPTDKFYVNDYADLIDSDLEDYIVSINKELYSKTGAQIVVVTVNDLGGRDIEGYATELFREFGIGDSTKNNGLLLLLALEERQFRIEVGYGLEGTLTDGKSGRIQDEYIIPYLKNDDWNNGIKNGFNACLEVVLEEYDITIDGSVSPEGVSYNSEPMSPLEMIMSLLVFVRNCHFMY